MLSGLLASTALNVVIGAPDAFGALTFAQRIAGALVALSGVVQGAAALAVIDYWGRRRLRFSGALVLVGVFVALAISGILLFMWLEERELTPYLLVFLPLFCWSLWALSLLIREKPWKRLPLPKTFAAGVVATASLTALSLIYSTLYQPAAAPVRFHLKARFERPQVEDKGPFVNIPLRLYAKNAGAIPVYVIMGAYTVEGKVATLSDGGVDIKEGWREKVEETPQDMDAQLGVRQSENTKIGAGLFQDPGSWLGPGEEYGKQKMIHVPKDSGYDTIEVTLKLGYMRKDRGRLDSEFGSPIYSWSRGAGRHYCPPSRCGEYIVYQGRVQHNNNLVNVTRKPRYVTATWRPGRDEFFISSFRSGTELSYAEREEISRESRREVGRYGVAWVDANAVIPVAEVLRRH